MAKNNPHSRRSRARAGSSRRSRRGKRSPPPSRSHEEKMPLPIKPREHRYPPTRRTFYWFMVFLMAGSVVFFYIWVGRETLSLVRQQPLYDPLGTAFILLIGLILTPLFIYLTWWLLGNITLAIVVEEAGLEYRRLGRRISAPWSGIEGYREALARSPYGANRVTTIWVGEHSFYFHDGLSYYDHLLSIIRKRVKLKEEPLQSLLDGGRVGPYLWLIGRATLAVLGVIVIVLGILGAVSCALDGNLLGIAAWLTLFLLGFGLVAWVPEEFNRPLRAMAGRLGELGVLGGGLLLFSLVWLYPTVSGLQQENRRQVATGLLLLGACFLPGAGLSLVAWWRGRESARKGRR
jgi:hypothetical protein